MLKVLEGGKGRNEKQQDEVREGIQFTLDDLAREGARRMIAAALKMEAEEYVVRHVHERDGDDHAIVPRQPVIRAPGGGRFWMAGRLDVVSRVGPRDRRSGSSWTG